MKYIIIAFSFLFILTSCKKEDLAHKAPVPFTEKPSPHPEDAILNTVNALNAGDTLGVLSTFITSMRPEAKDNFAELHSLIHDNGGTKQAPWIVKIIHVELDSANSNSATVIFSFREQAPGAKFMDSLYQRVILENGYWRHGKFEPLKKEEFLKGNR